MGALERVEEGNRVYHTMRPEHRLWIACSLMIETTEDPAPILRDALRDVSGVRAAFLFGSTANGRSRADSDLDLFLLEGPSTDRTRGLRQLAEAGLLLGREVNTIRYTERSLAERLGEAAHPGAAFVRGVLIGPKLWVAGSPEALFPLATAAGLTLNQAEDETR